MRFSSVVRVALLGSISSVMASPQMPGMPMWGASQQQAPMMAVMEDIDVDDTIYRPASPTLPPFEVMDLDHNGVVTTQEMETCVTRLYTVARQVVEPADDPIAKAFLMDAVGYHYNMLRACVRAQSEDVASLEPDKQFSATMSRVSASCNVKFAYSIVGSAPPFEWIARRAPEVAPQAVVDFLWDNYRKVQKDQERFSGGMHFPPVEMMETLMKCIADIFAAPEYESVNRDEFYQMIFKVGPCVH